MVHKVDYQVDPHSGIVDNCRCEDVAVGMVQILQD